MSTRPGIRSGRPAARQPRGAEEARRRCLSAPLRRGTRRSTRSWPSTARKTGEELEAAQITHAHGRPHPRDPQLRQGQLPRPLGRQGAHPGLHPAGRAAGARLQDLQAARLRRLGRRRGAAVPDEDERAHDLGVDARVPRQVPAAAAGEVARPAGRRDPLPPALSRSDRQSRVAARVRGAQPRRRGDPRVPDRPRLPRGRDADDAADRRRRAGAAVRDASQRARHAALHAHRAGAVPEAADRRRHRAGVRDQPQLPERGDLDAAQPRVHDARVLLGVRRLQRSDDADRGDAAGGGAQGGRAPTRCTFGEHAISLAAAVPAPVAARGARARRRRSGSASDVPPRRAAVARRGGGAGGAARRRGRRRPWARGRSPRRSSRRSAKTTSSSRRSSTTSRPRSRRCRSRSRTIRTPSSGSSCTSAASRWPTRSAS